MEGFHNRRFTSVVSTDNDGRWLKCDGVVAEAPKISEAQFPKHKISPIVPLFTPVQSMPRTDSRAGEQCGKLS